MKEALGAAIVAGAVTAAETGKVPIPDAEDRNDITGRSGECEAR
jgi:hypothetical protein